MQLVISLPTRWAAIYL